MYGQGFPAVTEADNYQKLKMLSSSLLDGKDEDLSFAAIACIKKLKLDMIDNSMREFEKSKSLDLPSLSSFTSLLPPIEITSKLVKSLIKRDQVQSQNIDGYSGDDGSQLDDEDRRERRNLSISFDSLNINPFYSSAFKKSVHYGVVLNDLDYDYMTYEVPLHEGIHLNLSQLQLQLRIELLKNTTNWQTIDYKLKQLSHKYLACDTAASIAAVLPLFDHSEEKPFKLISSPPPLITLLALYLYSLIFCLRRNHVKDLPVVSVETVISRAQQIIREENYLVDKYNKKFSNFLHCQELLFLDPSVDVDRFCEEDEYRKDTLLGLAMTDNEQTFLKVVKIAQEYKLELWDVYITYLEYLLTNVNYDVEIVASRVFKQEFIDILAVKHKHLEKHFNTRIFPLIPSDDHNRTVLCYQIIEKIGCAASPKDIEDDDNNNYGDEENIF